MSEKRWGNNCIFNSVFYGLLRSTSLLFLSGYKILQLTKIFFAWWCHFWYHCNVRTQRHILWVTFYILLSALRNLVFLSLVSAFQMRSFFSRKTAWKKKTIYSIKTSSYHKIIKILDTSASYYSLAWENEVFRCTGAVLCKKSEPRGKHDHFYESKEYQRVMLFYLNKAVITENAL